MVLYRIVARAALESPSSSRRTRTENMLRDRAASAARTRHGGGGKGRVGTPVSIYVSISEAPGSCVFLGERACTWAITQARLRMNLEAIYIFAREQCQSLHPTLSLSFSRSRALIHPVPESRAPGIMRFLQGFSYFIDETSNSSLIIHEAQQANRTTPYPSQNIFHSIIADFSIK